MPRLPRPSSKAISTVVDDRGDPTLPVILEFQMPSTAITSAPVPQSARHVVWIIVSMLAAILVALGTIHVDRLARAMRELAAGKARADVARQRDVRALRCRRLRRRLHCRPGLYPPGGGHMA